ncbi:sensor histidine kinase [Thiosulfativibrio zosterae]|uniref:histidine kinase n=1 Tax=Thiosulfativibrio zosterae TaxID=2675053 RepID=A0A6F8PPZ4_9GAMM|nr:HAMP domain-containing sensor histidine kinase [Thiosulfativibrio zosterae]BBP44108.1 hypothetical protein THMIRHAT_18540 [Thiosulfativibrio zosterae]
MKLHSIRSLIMTLMFSASVLTLLLVAVGSWQWNQQLKFAELSHFSDELREHATDLTFLTAEYTVTKSERSKQQWFSKWSQAENLVSKYSQVEGYASLVMIRLLIIDLKEAAELSFGQNDSSYAAKLHNSTNLLAINQRLLAHTRLFQKTIEDQERATSAFYSNTLWAGLLFGWFIPIGLLFWVKHYIRQPIAQLAADARRFGRGELGAPVRPVSTVELSGLADSLEKMRVSLADNMVSIEKYSSLAAENEKAKLAAESLLQQIKRTQVELMKTEKMSSLGVLVGGVAHELNNPLMGVLNYVTYVEKAMSDKDSKSKNILIKAEVELARLQKIVKNMLQFGRQETTENTYFDILPVLTLVLDLVHPDLKRFNIQTEVDAPMELPQVFGEPNKLEQVVLNLVVNARDALNEMPALEHPKITFRIAVQESELVLEICDNGCGIPDAIKSKIFDPFFTTKEVGKGTGLGLAVSTQLMADMHGRLLVSPTHEGACFQMILQCQAA